jgi:hypothetical protein
VGVVSVRTQYSNLGDRLITRAAIAALREQVAHVYVLAEGAPADFLADLELDAATCTVVHRTRTVLTDPSVRREVLRRGRSQVLLWRPGAIIVDRSTSQVLMCARQWAVAHVARLAGWHQIEHGTSYEIRDAGDPRSRLGVALLRSAARAKTVVAPRDHASTRLLGRDHRGADLAALAVDHPAARAARTVDATGRTLLACSLRLAHPVLSEQDRRTVAAVVRAIAHGRGLDAVQSAQVTADAVPWSGLPLHHATALDEGIAWFGCVRAVVTDRLHVALVAALAGAVPVVVAAPGNDKAARYLRDLGLGRLVIDAPIPAAQLETVLTDAVEDGSTLRHEVLDALLDERRRIRWSTTIEERHRG